MLNSGVGARRKGLMNVTGAQSSQLAEPHPLFDRISKWTERLSDQLLFSFLDDNGRDIENHTYISFEHRFNSIAAFLTQQAGLSRGDRVVLVFPPGLELICSIFACVRAGFIPVPTSAPIGHSKEPSLRRLAGIVSSCSPVYLLSNSKGYQFLSEAINDISFEDYQTVSNLRCTPWLNTDDIHTVEPSAYRPILAHVMPAKTFLIQYTSGSTSEPKGVMVSVENIIANADLVVDHARPICVSWLPQHHDMGLLGYYVYILLHGGRTYGFSPSSFIQRPLLWLEAISKYKATATSVPNFALQMCLNTSRVSDASLPTLNLSSLRFLMAAAEPIKSQTYLSFISRFKKCGLKEEAFFVAYGLAEFTLAVTNYGRHVLNLDAHAMSKGDVVEVSPDSENKCISLLSCGKPLQGNTIRIVNKETRVPCLDGTIGEVWVDGDSKATGYWGCDNAANDNFKCLIPDDNLDQTFLRTGDMGFLWGNELYICGREKEMIVIRGQNFFPQDIEEIVAKYCPELRPRAVVAFEYEQSSRPKIGLIVETKVQFPQSYTRLIQTTVSSKLGVEIQSVTFVPSKTLPRTTSGKLMRVEAKRRWINNQLGTSLSGFSNESIENDLPNLCDARDLDEFMAGLAKIYGVKGNESCTISDIGIDSIELVTLVSLIKDELASRGAQALAEKVDIRLIQAISICQFYQLYEVIKTNSLDNSSAHINLVSSVEAIHKQRLASELQQMKSDVVLLSTHTVRPYTTERDILLTGGTGFLGPFLLKSLLEQTPLSRKIKVLVRAESRDQAQKRLRKSFINANYDYEQFLNDYDRRVEVVCGNLSANNLSLSDSEWQHLADSVSTIFHNGAQVNYLMSYGAMREANVLGTSELLKLASHSSISDFNLISTTFIFGWARKSALFESDNNSDMSSLDFGYSQSKWVAERLVFSAAQAGLPIRIFRPSLITPSVTGNGSGLDISLRLLLFMIKHRLTVDSLNQVSFTPVDITANNIIAISQDPSSVGGTYHVVRDNYNTMSDITDLIASFLGIKFKSLPINEFVEELIQRCTSDDPLYPLKDFLVHSEANIKAMESKRYSSSDYQIARSQTDTGVPDPSLKQTVSAILAYLTSNYPRFMGDHCSFSSN